MLFYDKTERSWLRSVLSAYSIVKSSVYKQPEIPCFLPANAENNSNASKIIT